MKHKYTNDDHKNILMESVESLIDLCDLCDKGKFTHGRSISVILRTMLYDTNQSVSMFNHTGIIPTIKMADSGIESTSDTSILISLIGGRYLIRPDLYSPLFISSVSPIIVPRFMVWYECQDYIPFTDWWEKPIIIRDSYVYSRKEIIKLTANKFGGAHVDSKINKDFYDLAMNFESFAYISEGRNENGPTGNISPVENSIYAIIRQIAHEVLISIKNLGFFNVNYVSNFTNTPLLFNDTRFTLEFSKTEDEMDELIKEGKAYEK